jgi:rhodanese-related sulfurtransferase
MANRTLADMLEEARARIEVTTPPEITDAVSSGGVLFLDIREPEEWQAAHVPEAVHIPRGMLEFRADPASQYYDARLGSGKPIVVSCASGGRSALATALLGDMGYENVRNLDGGMKAWEEAGHRVERG